MYQKDKKSAAEHVDNAMSDFKSGKNELKSAKDAAVSGARSEFKNATDGTVRNLREHAREAGEKVQDFLGHRREDLTHAKDSAERTIRANPLASAAAAFGIGLILSRLFKR